MSDIFLSYAREDKDRVQSFARALEQKGWTVWWDLRIRTGRGFQKSFRKLWMHRRPSSWSGRSDQWNQTGL